MCDVWILLYWIYWSYVILLDYRIIFSPDEYEKNDKKWKNYIALFVVGIEILKKKKIKKSILSIICRKCKNEEEKIFKEEELIEILKILCLIENIQF